MDVTDSLLAYNVTVMNELKSWIQSSQDPTQVSNTVRGVVLSASALIIFFGAQFLHLTLSADDIASLATEIGAIAGGIWAIYGLVMKVVMLFGKK